MNSTRQPKPRNNGKPTKKKAKHTTKKTIEMDTENEKTSMVSFLFLVTNAKRIC